MNEHAQVSELKDVFDVARRVARRDPNNLALADQIQFSSILRTLVDTPEQNMAVVEATTQSREADKQRPNTEEREDRAARRAERRSEERDEARPRRADAPPAERKDIAAPQRSAQVQVPETTAASDAAPTAAPVEPSLPVEPTQRASRAPVEWQRLPETIPAAAKVEAGDAVPRATPGPAADPQRIVSAQAARDVVAAALADRQFASVGEDMHDAVMHRFANVGTRAGAQTAAVSLKDLQESDLARRLNSSAPVAIQVDIAGDAAKQRALQPPTQAADLSLAALDDLYAESPFAPSYGKNPSDGFGAGQKAPNHANAAQDRALPMQNGMESAFQQALRAQGALIVAQQAAQAGGDARPVLPADVIQVNPAAGPNGPSQISQTAKANAATAARQPERPQLPTEQIAVKIRQAVGEGLDKINIKLNPAHLGRVEVRLDIKDGHITATVLAERKETLEMLQRDARGLERALLDAGLRTDIQSLSFGMRGDGQRHLDANRERRNGGGREFGRDDGNSGRGDNDKIEKTGGHIRHLRSIQSVDIRV